MSEPNASESAKNFNSRRTLPEQWPQKRHGRRRGPCHGTLLSVGYLVDFQRGLATNLLNPKSLIFCSVLLPQFIHPELSGYDGGATARGNRGHGSTV